MLSAKWLVCPHQRQTAATELLSFCGCIGKSGLSVLNSQRRQPQSYLLVILVPVSVEVALWLQYVAVVDRQATFTDTSTRISKMEVALWLPLLWTDKPISQILPPE